MSGLGSGVADGGNRPTVQGVSALTAGRIKMVGDTASAESLSPGVYSYYIDMLQRAQADTTVTAMEDSPKYYWAEVVVLCYRLETYAEQGETPPAGWDHLYQEYNTILAAATIINNHGINKLSAALFELLKHRGVEASKSTDPFDDGLARENFIAATSRFDPQHFTYPEATPDFTSLVKGLAYRMEVTDAEVEAEILGEEEETDHAYFELEDTAPNSLDSNALVTQWYQDASSPLTQIAEIICVPQSRIPELTPGTLATKLGENVWTLEDFPGSVELYNAVHKNDGFYVGGAMYRIVDPTGLWF